MPKCTIEKIDTNKLIQQVADFKAKTAFVKKYQTKETLNERQIEGLGIAISQWANWEGHKILNVFKYALEDTNYHDLADKVQKMIDN